jgi:phosphonopyruvate decarboxylase
MIEAEHFVEAARTRGFAWYAGVPCSFLTPFINYVIDDPSLTYVSAANEGDAVAAAAGAYIGGQYSVAMMQNSGLGNAVSPLTSLTYVFRIPLLIICTHRGAPGVQDEPQHELMGQITERLFDTMQIPWEVFPKTRDQIAPALARAVTHFERESRPYALIMQKGTVAPHVLRNRGLPSSNTGVDIGADMGAADLRANICRAARAREIVGTPINRAPPRISRAAALAQIIAVTPVRDTVLIASTGFTGRELYALSDRPNQLYMVGSMGCAPSLGLGLAMRRPDLRVFIIDGDGAALMRMGNMATIGTYGPPNLYHLLLDNEAHDSTGAQATVSGNMDFAAVAQACGYGYVMRAESADAIADLVRSEASGPRFLHLRIKTGTIENLPRPTVTPLAVLQRLRRHCAMPA